MLVKDVPRTDVGDVFQNVSFITFNYDRSFQQFLIYALVEAYDLKISRAVELVRDVPFHHVYGSLGGLPDFNQKPTTAFGRKAGLRDIAFISENLRTYTESIADKPEASSIRSLTGSAQRIVFLGCGFHRQNIEILQPTKGLSGDAEIIATTHGLSQTDMATVCNRLVALYQNAEVHMELTLMQRTQAGLHRMTCTELMDEYSLGLTD
jgi:hypothetical protein